MNGGRGDGGGGGIRTEENVERVYKSGARATRGCRALLRALAGSSNSIQNAGPIMAAVLPSARLLTFLRVFTL